MINRRIIQTLWPQNLSWSLGAAEWQVLENVAGQFIRTQLRIAPFWTKYPLLILSAAFSVYLAIIQILPITNTQAIQLWERCGGLPARSLIRALRSMLLLAIV